MYLTATPRPLAEVAAPHYGPALDAAALRVIALARHDVRRIGWEGRTAGWAARLWHMLAGTDPVRPLADRRLELIRLFVCMLRRRDARADAVAAELIEIGFAPATLHKLVALALG